VGKREFNRSGAWAERIEMWHIIFEVKGKYEGGGGGGASVDGGDWWQR
jgi:hypothetical protein